MNSVFVLSAIIINTISSLFISEAYTISSFLLNSGAAYLNYKDSLISEIKLWDAVLTYIQFFISGILFKEIYNYLKIYLILQ